MIRWTHTADADASTWESEARGRLSRLMLALVAIGVLWRLVRYCLQFPIWGDEAMLCLNLLDLDYWGLTRQLKYAQIAPIGYLWSQLTVVHLFGTSELALHLLPFLSGLGALLLFWLLVRQTLTPLARTLAVGILAVAIWPISMSTQAKPYAFDLFWSLALLLPAARWLRQPQDWRWLAVLATVVGLAIACSYPVVFVAGAISVALAVPVWQQRDLKCTGLFSAFNLMMIAAFLGHYFFIGKNHLATPVGVVNTDIGMRDYWAEAFPPRSLLAVLPWTFLMLTGEMMSQPIGAASGGSILNFLLCLVGARYLWLRGQRALVLMLSGPFVLGLAAAALHRYPFGAARLSQHLAPSIIFLMAAGLCSLILRAPSAAARWRWTLTACAALALFGLGGMTRDIIRPGKDHGVIWVRQVIRDLFERAGRDPILVVCRYGDCDAVFFWYLSREGERVTWDGDQARAHLCSARSLWCLCFAIPYEARAREWQQYLDSQHWVVQDHIVHMNVTDPREQFPGNLLPTRSKTRVEQADLYHWVRQPSDDLAAK